jgi:hypothetical protein
VLDSAPRVNYFSTTETFFRNSVSRFACDMVSFLVSSGLCLIYIWGTGNRSSTYSADGVYVVVWCISKAYGQSISLARCVEVPAWWG